MFIHKKIQFLFTKLSEHFLRSIVKFGLLIFLWLLVTCCSFKTHTHTHQERRERRERNARWYEILTRQFLFCCLLLYRFLNVSLSLSLSLHHSLWLLMLRFSVFSLSRCCWWWFLFVLTAKFDSEDLFHFDQYSVVWYCLSLFVLLNNLCFLVDSLHKNNMSFRSSTIHTIDLKLCECEYECECECDDEWQIPSQDLFVTILLLYVLVEFVVQYWSLLFERFLLLLPLPQFF